MTVWESLSLLGCLAYHLIEYEPPSNRLLQNAQKKWTMPIQNWSLAMNQMAILFEGRMLIPGLTENSITQKI